MNPKRLLWRSLQVALVLALAALLLGQLLGQPILLSFVTTGSMEPTLSPGDGFVALPTEITGSPGQGDVVVFDAQEIEGGGLTTHRIVGETEHGFETRGDANPFTDQDGGEPPIQEAEVLAVAWQPGGEVLAIPYLGTVVMAIQSGLESLQWTLAQFFGIRSLLGLQGIAYLLLTASILLYILDVWLAGSERHRRTASRKKTRGISNRRIVLALTLIVLIGPTAAMVGPSGTHEFGIVSAEFESDSPTVIEQGASETYEHEVVNNGLIPTVVVFEPASDNIEAEPDTLSLERQSSERMNVTITAPPETGHYHSFLEERRYIGILPTTVLLSLDDIHPWLALGVINAMIGIPFYIFGILLLGRGQTRIGTRERPSLLARIRARVD